MQEIGRVAPAGVDGKGFASQPCYDENHQQLGGHEGLGNDQNGYIAAGAGGGVGHGLLALFWGLGR